MTALLLRFWPQIAIAMALISVALWFSHVRYDAGFNAATAKMQRSVDTANELTRLADAQAAATTRKAAQAIEGLRNERSVETINVMAAAQPVRLCKPAADRREMSAATGTSAAADRTQGVSESPVRVGDDISRPLILFAAQCQRDLDDAIAWQEWYAAQSVN